MRRPCLSLSTLLLTACLPNGQAALDPPRYPELKRVDATIIPFLPDRNLSPVTLDCRSSELPGDNGLDDDCDGRIDGAPANPSELTITVAYPADASGQVRLELRDDSGAGSPTLSGAPQDPRASTSLTSQASRGPAANVSRLELPRLAKGRYRVTATLERRERPLDQQLGRRERPLDGTAAGGAELPAAVSLASQGTSRAYLVRLGADETRTLGVIEIR